MVPIAANSQSALRALGSLFVGALLLHLGCTKDATQIRAVIVDGGEELLLAPVPFEGPDGSALVEITAKRASSGATAAVSGSAEGSAAGRRDGETVEGGAVEHQAGAVPAGATISFLVTPSNRLILPPDR